MASSSWSSSSSIVTSWNAGLATSVAPITRPLVTVMSSATIRMTSSSPSSLFSWSTVRLGVAGLGLEVVEVDRDAAQELVPDQPLGLLAVRPDVEDAAGVDQRAVLGPVDGVDPADDHRRRRGPRRSGSATSAAAAGRGWSATAARSAARRRTSPRPGRGSGSGTARRTARSGRRSTCSGASTPGAQRVGSGHQRRVVDDLVGGQQLDVEELAALGRRAASPDVAPVAGPDAGHLVVQLGAVARGHARRGHVLASGGACTGSCRRGCSSGSWPCRRCRWSSTA